MFVYLVTSLVALIISLDVKNNTIRKLLEIYCIPIYLLIALAGFFLPLLTMVFQSFFYLIVSVLVPLFILQTLSYFNLASISKELSTYIVLTSTVFIAVLFNNYLLKIVQWLSNLLFKNSSFVEEAKLNDLTDYAVSQNTLKFLIYSIYVILIIIMNIYKLQGGSLYDNKDYDVAVLQSFVTFLAFDKAYALLQTLDFKPAQFISMMIFSIRSLNNLEEEDNNENKDKKME